jgi:hypothetical protein
MKRNRHVKRCAAVIGLLVLASLSVFAKDVRTIKLPDPAWLAGAELVPGSYELSWVSHSPEATVTLKQGKNVVATVEGKWVERNVKYDRNALVYEIGTSGSRKIVEIRLAGKSQALVFDTPGSKESASSGEPTASMELPCAPTAVGATFAASAGNGRCIQFLGKPSIVRRANAFDNLTGDMWHDTFPERSHAVMPQRK